MSDYVLYHRNNYDAKTNNNSTTSDFHSLWKYQNKRNKYTQWKFVFMSTIWSEINSIIKWAIEGEWGMKERVRKREREEESKREMENESFVDRVQTEEMCKIWCHRKLKQDQNAAVYYLDSTFTIIPNGMQKISCSLIHCKREIQSNLPQLSIIRTGENVSRIIFCSGKFSGHRENRIINC